MFIKSEVDPLYYAAFCGFHDLAKHTIVKSPQHVNLNAHGDCYVTPAGQLKRAQFCYLSQRAQAQLPFLHWDSDSAVRQVVVN